MQILSDEQIKSVIVAELNKIDRNILQIEDFYKNNRHIFITINSKFGNEDLRFDIKFNGDASNYIGLTSIRHRPDGFMTLSSLEDILSIVNLSNLQRDCILLNLNFF